MKVILFAFLPGNKGVGWVVGLEHLDALMDFFLFFSCVNI